MERKEKQLLTIVKTTYIGTVNLNGGKAKGQRHSVETVEGIHGQVWVMSGKSLEKNYPIGKARYYDLKQIEYLGELTWKFEVYRTDALTAEDKAHRTKASASSKQAVLVERTAGPLVPAPDPNLCNTIVCATAYIAATLLASNDKEHVDEILPRALLMKTDIAYMIDEEGKKNHGGQGTEDDIAPF